MGGEVKKKSFRVSACREWQASSKKIVEQQIHGKNNKNNDNQSRSLFNNAFSTALVTQNRKKDVYT
jgi:hypothetical protein